VLSTSENEFPVKKIFYKLLFISKRAGFIAFSLDSLNIEFLKSLVTIKLRRFAPSQLPDSIRKLKNVKFE